MSKPCTLQIFVSIEEICTNEILILHQNKFCTKIRNYDFNLVVIIKISTKWDYGYTINPVPTMTIFKFPRKATLEWPPPAPKPRELGWRLFITSSSWIWALRYLWRCVGRENGGVGWPQGHTNDCYSLFFSFSFFLLDIFFIYISNFKCYPKSSLYLPLPTLFRFLALAFPCTGAYKVCNTKGPLFPMMAD